MENMLLGLRALGVESYELFLRITHYQLFWGFTIGFFVSTLVHGFLFMESPKQVPSVLLNDPAVSFQELHQRTDTGYQQSYYAFTRAAHKTKTVFGLAGLLLLLIVLYVII